MGADYFCQQDVKRIPGFRQHEDVLFLLPFELEALGDRHDRFDAVESTYCPVAKLSWPGRIEVGVARPKLAECDG